MDLSKDYYDLSEPMFYRLFVISESRYYEFKKPTSFFSFLENFVSHYFDSYKITSNFISSNGAMPPLDALSYQVQFLAHETLNSSSFWFQMISSQFTFGTSLLSNGQFLASVDSYFVSEITKAYNPLFTSKEKAQEFLLDLTRMFQVTSFTQYIEYSLSGIKLHNFSDVVVVPISISNSIIESKITPFVINPYVPAYFK